MGARVAQQSARDFWRRGSLIVGLFLVQGVFAEDIVLAMNEQRLNLSWFTSLLTVSSQFVVAYCSLLLTASKSDSMAPQLSIEQRLRAWAADYRWEYAVAGSTIVLYQVMANNATFMLNFNTVQLFKTSRIVFVMLMSWALLHRPYRLRSWALALLLTWGLYVLSTADAAGKQRSGLTGDIGPLVKGFATILFSMVFIAVNTVLQEAVLKRHVWTAPWKRMLQHAAATPRAPKVMESQIKDKLIFYSNLLTTSVLLVGSAWNGELIGGLGFFARSSHRFWIEQCIIVCIGAWGQRLMLDLAQDYGATSATVVTTFRKTVTFALSVVIFPKPFSFAHAVALVVVSAAACFLQLQLMAEERAAAAKAAHREAVEESSALLLV